MSRCFPFPPPGYEKKARNEGVDLLTKEKHKEKKHKKEKRDKEKREGKERKDKERSKDKHREKKERKEKQRDRKKDEDNNNDKNRILEERRLEGRNESYNGEKLGGNSYVAEEIKDSKFMELLDRKVRYEESGSGNQMVEKSTGTLQRRIEGTGRLVEKISEGKERNKDKESDVKRGDRKRDRDQEKRNKGKDKDRDREKEKEKEKEKVKPKGEHDELRASVKNIRIDAPNIKLQYPSKNSDRIAVSEENLGKRKDIDTNGVLDEIDVRPHKLPQTGSSPHLPMVNGRRLETCYITIPCTSGRSKLDNKEPKVNGIIETSSSYSSSPSVSIEARENGEASTKPPHPDSKYLSQILTVPKIEELSDLDAQDWLFSGDGHRSKPTLVSEVTQEASQVWAEVLRIESADVFVLPYVLPY